MVSRGRPLHPPGALAVAIKPNSLFLVWSPDEVAECLEGILPQEGLYQALWALTKEYENEPRSEVPDDFGDRCLAKYWDKLSQAYQVVLNDLADKHHKRYG